MVLMLDELGLSKQKSVPENELSDKNNRAFYFDSQEFQAPNNLGNELKCDAVKANSHNSQSKLYVKIAYDAL